MVAPVAVCCLTEVAAASVELGEHFIRLVLPLPVSVGEASVSVAERGLVRGNKARGTRRVERGACE